MQIQIEMQLHVGSEEGGNTSRQNTQRNAIRTQYGAGTDADAGGWVWNAARAGRG